MAPAPRRHSPDPPAPRERSRALAIGAFAALLSGATMIVGRVLASARTPVDMLFDMTGHVLGVPTVFNLIHRLPFGLDHLAKYALFATMALLYVALWTFVAVPLTRLARPWRVLLPAGLTPALVGLVLLPAEGLGLFGTSATNYFYPPLSTHLWAILFGGIYGAALLVAPERSVRADRDEGRRDALGKAARALLLLGVGAGLLRTVLGAVVRAAGAEGLIGKIRGVGPYVTPVKDHYVVSKNFVDPTVDAARWRLKVHGLVDHPLDLSLADLQALPSVTRTSTLICISNEVGGHLVGNSAWTGVPMRDLLETAGVQAGATEIVMRAADNYSDSIPIGVGRRDGTIVAYLQDGEPLVRGHGFPARVLAPGIYGMKSVKWLVDLELVAKPYTGYWQQRGWSRTAEVRTMSRIDTPTATIIDDGPAAIGGIAFAGIRGVRTVQVSTDDGGTWRDAVLRPPDNTLSWTLWGFEWEAPQGDYEVLVRAVDGNGTLQTAQVNQPLPDGSSGYHRVKVRVR